MENIEEETGSLDAVVVGHVNPIVTVENETVGHSVSRSDLQAPDTSDISAIPPKEEQVIASPFRQPLVVCSRPPARRWLSHHQLRW